MKCPHCHDDLPSLECPECHEKTLIEGKFCAFCGTELPLPDSTGEAGDDASDFSDRILCSDGTCIGVINEQGVCNECGKPYAEETE
ncbi:MAG: hypothetical protein JRI47_02970 [Deltaproteobacteria bacterium]|nr:hypothetical protein [Deltaproteobacteria bacterium]